MIELTHFKKLKVLCINIKKDTGSLLELDRKDFCAGIYFPIRISNDLNVICDKRHLLVSGIGQKRFLCRNIFPNFPVTGSQYFTLKVVTHPVETSFKD